MNTPDFGEPWSLSSFRNCIYTRHGKLEDIVDGLRSRSLKCVNACAGIEDPVLALQNAVAALRSIASEASKIWIATAGIPDAAKIEKLAEEALLAFPAPQTVAERENAALTDLVGQ